MFEPVDEAIKFVKHCRRVVRVATKPNNYEYVSAVKITGLGIAIIGLVGFLIFMVFQLLQVP